MLKIILSAAVVVAFTSAAWAKCPAGTKYDCYQGYGGKVVCGCR